MPRLEDIQCCMHSSSFYAAITHYMAFCICSVVQQKGVQLVTDSVSYELLKGSVVDYTTDLIRASFEVTQHPAALAGPFVSSDA